MGDNQPQNKNKITPIASSWFEKIRSFIALKLRSLFSPPYLPGILIVFIVLLVFTEACFDLMNQPVHYWVDHSYATGSSLVRAMLNTSPLLYLGAYIAYILVVAFVLGILNRRVALVLWTILFTVHLVSAADWVRCGWSRLVVFDSNSCNVFQFGTTLLGAAVAGIILSAALFAGALDPWPSKIKKTTTRKPKTQPTKKTERSWAWMTMLALWPLMLTAGVITSMTIPDTGWRPLVTAHSPKGRAGGVIVYDTKRNRAILFGGASAWTGKQYIYENDTWIWDGKDWSKIDTPVAPPARSNHAMAYDEKTDTVVLFGGENQSGKLGDTWVFDGASWHDHGEACACGLKARGYHEMFYDPARGEVVLYGGLDLNGTFNDDAWAWDGSQWQQIYFNSLSPVASGYSLVYDSARSQAFGFLSGSPGGTWIWKGTDWQKLELPLQPSNRTGSAMAYDPLTQKIVLYGGTDATNTTLDETWVFDGNGWSKMNIPSTLGGRAGASMFFDKTLNRMLLFGGYQNGVYYNDMSELFYP